MKEILDKISSYNIFNFLLPGIVFTPCLKRMTYFSIPQSDNLIVNAFTVYFIGLIISRFGSLIIEPLLLKIRFVRYAPYDRFLHACTKDPKIELFVEISNQYRTILSMTILLGLAKFYQFIDNRFNIGENATDYLWLSILVVMFAVSYRKQTNYISKRVDANQ